MPRTVYNREYALRDSQVFLVSSSLPRTGMNGRGRVRFPLLLVLFLARNNKRANKFISPPPSSSSSSSQHPTRLKVQRPRNKKRQKKNKPRVQTYTLNPKPTFLPSKQKTNPLPRQNEKTNRSSDVRRRTLVHFRLFSSVGSPRRRRLYENIPSPSLSPYVSCPRPRDERQRKDSYVNACAC